MYRNTHGGYISRIDSTGAGPEARSSTSPRLEENPMERVTLNISGMTCGHCVRGVTQALGELGGVEVERVTVGQATVRFDPSTATTARIAQAVEAEGYTVVSTQ